MFVRDILLILFAAVIISFVIKTFFIRSFYIPSASMENTLQIDDRVIVSLLTPGLVPLARGDVVVFEDPGGWIPTNEERPSTPDSPVTEVLAFLGLAAPNDNSHLIKRVIGLPGDHVSCCTAAGRLKINGSPIAEPFIAVAPGLPADPFPFSVTVPKGELWVMGDNRDDSDDSAYHYTHHDASAFVPISDVTGRAVLISWPINRWTFLSDYQSDFQIVNKSQERTKQDAGGL